MFYGIACQQIKHIISPWIWCCLRLPASGICLHNQLAIDCPVYLLKQRGYIGGSESVSIVGRLKSSSVSILCMSFKILFFVVSHQVMSDSPWPHGLQYTRLLCPSLSQSWLRLMSIESVMPYNHLILCCPFSSCPQSFPTSGSFPVSWLFASGGPSVGVFSLSIVVFHYMSSLSCCFFYDARPLWLLGSLQWIHLCVLSPSTLLLRTCVGQCLKSSPVPGGHMFQRGALVLVPQVASFHLTCFNALPVWQFPPLPFICISYRWMSILVLYW